MTPKKKRGFRSIKVSNKIFYWRFAKIIDIRPQGNISNKLIIDIGWFDIWLYSNDKVNRPEDIAPTQVTPKLVSNSILYAIENGWDIEASNKITKIKYRNELFQMD